MKKSAVIGISLVLVVAASVSWWFWPDRSVEADRPVEFESELSPAEGMLPAEQGTEFRGAREKLTDGEHPPKRESVKKGAQRRFSLRRGEIGYVDVPSLVNDLDTYSVVAVLQEHAELTGADESLEIVTHGVYENERWGYEAQFAQVIEGVETGWVGNILFSADGQVSAIRGKLVNTRALSVNSMVLLAPEVEAVALEAAANYAETIPDRPEWSDTPVRLEVLPSAMLFELDENDALHRLWRVPVSISGPKFDNVEVVVSAESGRIVRMKSVVREQASACSVYPCDDASNTTIRPANQSAHQIAVDTIKAIRSKSMPHIQRKPGQACQIDLITGADLQGANGKYFPVQDVIAIREGISGSLLESAVEHEVLHSVSKTSKETIEEGLVYAMEDLRTGGNWTAVSGTVDFKRTMRGSSRPTYSYVAHAMYRMSLRIGNEKAFEFVLRVDRSNPADLDEFHLAMDDVGEDMEIEDDVEFVLAAIGVDLSDTSSDSDDTEDDTLPAPSALPSVQLSNCTVKNADDFGALEAYLSVNSNSYVLSPGQLRIQGTITGQRLTDYQETIFANSQELNYATGRAISRNGGQTTISVFVSFDWSNLDTGNFGAVGDSCIIRHITEE